MIREAIWAYHAAGFSVIPCRTDGSKAPLLGSGYLDERRSRPTGLATDSEVEAWAEGNAFGILCGDLSGELEFLELEGRAVREGWLSALTTLLADNGLLDVWLRLWNGHRAVSPSGGIHLLFRISDGKALGNDPLAARPTTIQEKAPALLAGKKPTPLLVMIETRARGGYFVAPGSSSFPKADQARPDSPTAWTLDADGLGHWRLIHGSPTTVPCLTSAERDQLYAVARMLDRMPTRPDAIPNIGAADRPSWESSDGSTPRDDFEQRVDWAEILEPHGWVHVSTDARGSRYWRRPGKDSAGFGGDRGHVHSASTGRDPARDRMWVFSTSTDLDHEREMNKAYVWGILNHDTRDHSHIATQLRGLGFGSAAWADQLPIEPSTTAYSNPPVTAVVPQADLSIADNSSVLTTTTQQTQSSNPFADDYVDARPAVTWRPCDISGDDGESVTGPEGVYLSDSFWDARPVFGVLRQAAQRALASPEGVLVAALGMTLAHVMPNIVLPACVGVEASLNLMVVTCGTSGDGKSVCRKIAKQTLTFAGCEPVWEFPPSSGQGLAGQYQALRKPKGGEPYMETLRWTAMATVEESDKIAALASQASNTLSSELRAAAMGELIGSANVGDTKTNMPEGTYRFVLAMCMQPELSAWLLDEKAGGLPQRFLFACVNDARVVDAPSPGTWSVRLPFEATPDPVTGAPRGHQVMGVTDRICTEIRNETIARKRASVRGGLTEGYDGHGTLLRLKIAGAIAILDGRLNVVDEDWALAGEVAAASRATIRWMQSIQVSLASKKADQARVARVADAKAIKKAEGETDEQRTLARVATNVLKQLERNADGVTKRELTRSAGRDYVILGAALDELERLGKIHWRPILKGDKKVGHTWHLGPKYGEL